MFFLTDDTKNPLNGLSESEVAERLRSDGLLLQYLPKELQSDSLCSIALEQNPQAAKFVAYFAPMVGIDFVTKDWKNLGLIPEGERSSAICECAILADKEALELAPSRLKPDLAEWIQDGCKPANLAYLTRCLMSSQGF